VPGRWLRGLPLPEASIDALDGRLQIGPLNLRYDLLGLQKA